MLHYPLQLLLTARQYREDAAQNALRQAEHAVREAKAHVRKCQEEVARYHTWRLEEENRRYEAIMHQSLTLGELDAFKAGLAALQAEELQREKDVLQATRDADTAQKKVEEAKDKLAKARRETARILAHKDIWVEEAKREAERKEDLESEEFMPTSLEEH